MADSGFFSFDFGFRQTEFFINQAYTLVKAQNTIRDQRETATLAFRHQDEVVREQQKVTAFTSNKIEAGDAVADLENALDRIIDIRNSLFEARAAASTGDRATFDNALYNINLKAQDASQDSSNLIGWLGVDGNGVRSRTVNLGQNSFNIYSRSLGATYGIELDSGESIRPEFRDNEVELNEEKFLIAELNYESEAGGEITFSVGEGVDQQFFTGTVEKGGLGVASSWVYGDFDTTAFQDAAVADVNAALETLNAAERELNGVLIQAQYQYDKATSRTKDAQTNVDETVRRQLNEQQALERSIESRSQIAQIVLSLGAQQSLTQIDAIFRPQPAYTNTVLDTLGLFD